MRPAHTTRTVQLYGSLTHTSVTRCIIDSLAESLHCAVASGERSLKIDCSGVVSIDGEGLRLLTAWLQGAKTRGVEPELVSFRTAP